MVAAVAAKKGRLPTKIEVEITYMKSTEHNITLIGGKNATEIRYRVFSIKSDFERASKIRI